MHRMLGFLLAASALVLTGAGPSQKLPLVKLEGIGNAELDLATQAKGPRVVQFWASWCISCGGVTKQLGSLIEGAKKPVEVLSISLDETPEAAKSGVERMRVPGAKAQSYYFDRGRVLADQLGQVSVPTVLVVNAQGEILSRISGHWGESQKRELAARLAEL